MTRLPFRMPSPPASLRPFIVLTRNFFRRFFLSEEVGFEEEMKLKLIAASALVSALVGHTANSVLFKYMFIPDTGQSWVEKGYLMSLLMTLTSILVVIEWDILFLGRQDYHNLMPLPIRPGTLFWSKLASFVILVGLFTLMANALAVFAYAVYLPQWQPHGLAFTVRLVLAHLASSLAANVFTFLLFTVLVGFLMAVLSPGIFRWFSMTLRFLLLLFFVVFLVSLISDTLGDPRMFEFLNRLADRESKIIFLYPPLWFTGLYEWLLGNPDPVFKTLASYGGLASAIGLAAFYLVFKAGYRRQVVKSQEIVSGQPLLGSVRSGLARVFSAIALRNPVERAVFFFFGRTLARSARHKWRAAVTMSVPVALVFLLVSWAVTKQKSLNSPNGALLAAPIILSICLLAGLRALAASPVAPDANWIFRLTEVPVRRHYFLGLKKAVFWLGLVPLFLIVFAVSGLLWGWWTAFLHALFGLSISVLLEDIFFFRFSKIPFACSSLPGKERLHFLWSVYVGGFLIFVSLVSRLEASLFRRPAGFALFFPIIAALIALSALANKLRFYPRMVLIFEESPEPTFISLRPAP